MKLRTRGAAVRAVSTSRARTAPATGSRRSARITTDAASLATHTSAVSRIATELLALADATYAVGTARFFKAAYSKGDVFIGVRVPQCRTVVRTHLAVTSYADVVALLRDSRHELRIAGGICVVEAFTAPHKHAAWLLQDQAEFEAENNVSEVTAASTALATVVTQRRVVAFYLEHLACFDNWDLVDLTSHKVLGVWLVQQHMARIDAFCAHIDANASASSTSDAADTAIDVEREQSELAAAMLVLPHWYQTLLKSCDFWETRVSIVLLLGGAHIQRVSFALHICRWQLLRLLDGQSYEQRIKGERFHDCDLVHKACGWVLRECGKHDRAALLRFLDRYAALLPRTTMQYATEHLARARAKALCSQARMPAKRLRTATSSSPSPPTAAATVAVDAP